jgi:phage gp16-like protein
MIDASPSLKELRLGALAAVHIARKDLALDTDSYRAILRRLTGLDSAGLMTIEQLGTVLDEFRRLGWRPKHHAKRAGSRRLARGGVASKIRALWLSLYHLGAVRDPSEEALAHFIAETTGTEAMQWLDNAAADTVIKALRGWCGRVGFVQPDAELVRKITGWRAGAKLPPLAASAFGFAAKCWLIECQWKRLIALGALHHGAEASLETWLRREGGVSATYFLTPAAADRCIEKLGAWLRRVDSRDADKGEPA